MEAVIIVLVIALVAVGAIAVWLLTQQNRKPAEDPAAQRLERQLVDMQGELSQALNANQQTLKQHVDGIDLRLTQRLDSARTDMSQRLDAVDNRVGQSFASNQETIGKIGEQLGELGESARRIMDVGKDVSSLKDVLQPPKLRGNFGEMLLEQLVSQVLPADFYSKQYRFGDGLIVDLVIHTSGGLVPIDAKFPIDSFRRMLDANGEDDLARQRRQFLRDVRTRVEQCAKYIKPEENTLDIALMYVPSESIYYEAIAGPDDESVMAFALERNVHLVSPNTFHAFLQVVLRGFQRLEVEKDAEEIVARLGQLRNEFGRFRQEFEVLGRHVGHAKNKYDEVDRLAGRLGDRLEVPVQAPLPDPELGRPQIEPARTNGSEN